MSQATEEEDVGCETQLVGVAAKPSRLKLAASRVRHFVQEVKDRALTKFYPKFVTAAKKLPLGAESYKLLWIGLAAVAFVFVIWWIFDRRTPAADVDEILRPLSQAPEVSSAHVYSQLSQAEGANVIVLCCKKKRQGSTLASLEFLRLSADKNKLVCFGSKRLPGGKLREK